MRISLVGAAGAIGSAVEAALGVPTQVTRRQEEMKMVIQAQSCHGPSASCWCLHALAMVLGRMAVVSPRDQRRPSTSM